ncbi:SurA N-terminal domain-containing protein [Streptomyces sp. NPDC004609]|uniref:SurA N-terminal domain-containing protein n=1 Tax=Streptomyces sp. NPDC004609 TaxID=3364704 RepID=UPI003698B647
MHRRRRTAIIVSAALLLAAPLLSACSDQAHPGAAAVVGGERIEVSTVQGAVKQVRAAQENSPEAAELIKNSGQISRAKLYDLIVNRVVQRAADDADVTVSRKDMQAARTAVVRQAGGEEQLAAMYLQQRGVAPDQLDSVIRRDVLINKLAQSISAANEAEGRQKLNDAFTAAAKSLDIDVNPRFGAWDNQKLELGEYKAPWISQVTKPQEPVPATA